MKFIYDEDPMLIKEAEIKNFKWAFTSWRNERSMSDFIKSLMEPVILDLEGTFNIEDLVINKKAWHYYRHSKSKRIRAKHLKKLDIFGGLRY